MKCNNRVGQDNRKIRKKRGRERGRKRDSEAKLNKGRVVLIFMLSIKCTSLASESECDGESE